MKLTVLLPVYNAEKFLRDCLQSLTSQTFDDFKVIAVDDASTDGSLAILNEWAEKDNRFEVHALKENIGESGVMRKFMQTVDTEYTARMDADDVCHLKRFELQVKYLDEDKGIDVLGSHGITHPTSKLIMPPVKHYGLLGNALSANSPILNPSAVWRTASLRNAGIEFGATWGASDYSMWVDCFIAGLRLETLPMVLVRYSKHESQMTKNKYQMHKDTLVHLTRLWQWYYPQLSLSIINDITRLIYIRDGDKFKAGEVKDILNIVDRLDLPKKVVSVFGHWRNMVYPRSTT